MVLLFLIGAIHAYVLEEFFIQKLGYKKFKVQGSRFKV
jgi:hypothetical protein